MGAVVPGYKPQAVDIIERIVSGSGEYGYLADIKGYLADKGCAISCKLEADVAVVISCTQKKERDLNAIYAYVRFHEQLAI